MSVSRFFHISPEGKIAELEVLKDAISSLEKDGFVWFDFKTPTFETLAQLQEPLGLHQLAIEDCVSEDQIPKVDEFPQNTFVVFNIYHYRENCFSIDEVDFFLGRKFLVSVRSERSGESNEYEKIFELVRRSLGQFYKGPDFLFHMILDYIVDRKFTALEGIQDEIDCLEEKVIASPREFKPQDLMRIRGYLLELHKSLFHEREILIKICRRDSEFVSEQSIYFFRDVYDHLAKFFEFIEISREMLTSLMELYLSLMDMHHAEVSNQTNQVVKRLTIITTIFMPLTLLASIGGMSEWSMMWGAENWRVSYPLFFLLMGAIGVLCYRFLRWIKWV